MSSDSIPAIKKRTRPQPRVRELSIEREEEPNDEEPNLPYVNYDASDFCMLKTYIGLPTSSNFASYESPEKVSMRQS